MTYFKRNQKKFMAFFGVFLMIAFALPSAYSGYNKGREITVGHAGDYSITNKDIDRAKGEWEALRYVRLPQRDPNNPSAPPDAVSIMNALPASAQAQISSNEAVYFLLQREADRMGITVGQDEVQGVLANRVQASDERLSDAELAPAVESFIKVVTAADRAGWSIRKSAPETKLDLSRMQDFSANVVEFKAQDYLSKVPAYTDAERAAKLAEQYKAYKEFEPTTRPTTATGEPQNEFSFGYRVPNESQVHYFGVPHDAATRLVRGKITDVDAIRYYKEHPDVFPTTRPAEQVSFRAVPPPQGVASPTSQPSPRPIPEVFTREAQLDKKLPVNAPPMTYRDYKIKVYDELTSQRATTLTNDLLADAASVMASDYADYKKSPAVQAAGVTTAPATGPAAPNSSLGVPYPSYEYMEKLALREQQKFELLPTVGRSEGLWPAQQLAGLKDIGATTLPEWNLINRVVMQQTRNMEQALASASFATFAGYATSMIEPFPGSGNNSIARQLRIRTIAVLEPSPVFQSPVPNAGGSYLFRAVKAVASHPAPQAEVAEKLLNDARLKDAYALAQKDAEKFLADARKTRLESAATAAGKKVFATGMLNRGFGDVGTYAITDEATRRVFTDAAFGLLRSGISGQNPLHPVGIVELKPTATVLVGEVNELKPMWNSGNLSAFEREIAIEQERRDRSTVREQWFNADDVYRRSKYTSTTPTKAKTPAAPVEETRNDRPF